MLQFRTLQIIHSRPLLLIQQPSLNKVFQLFLVSNSLLVILVLRSRRQNLCSREDVACTDQILWCFDDERVRVKKLAVQVSEFGFEGLTW